MKGPGIAAITAILLIVAFIPVFAAVPVANSLGVKMEAFTFPDGDLSLYRPSGWNLTRIDNRLVLQENPADPLAPVITITTCPPSKDAFKSADFAKDQLNQLKSRNTEMKSEMRVISQKPDITGAVFSYQQNGKMMDGLAFAICRENQGIWAEITGSRKRLNQLNPALVLSYVLRSITRGPVPRAPGYKIPPHLLAKREGAVLRGSPIQDDPVSAATPEVEPSKHQKTWELMEHLFPEESGKDEKPEDRGGPRTP